MSVTRNILSTYPEGSVIQKGVVLPAIIRVDVGSVGKKLHGDVALEVRDTAIDTRQWEGLLVGILSLGLDPVLVGDRSGSRWGRRWCFARRRCRCRWLSRSMIVLALVTETAGASEELAAGFRGGGQGSYLDRLLRQGILEILSGSIQCLAICKHVAMARHEAGVGVGAGGR